MNPLKVPCETYDLATELYTSSILVNMPDGGVARITHRRIEVEFKHKRTGDKVVFRMTKKGNFYQNNGYFDERLSEDEAKDEFIRLIGDKDNGILAFKVSQMRMICGL